MTFCSIAAAQDYDLPSLGQPADSVLPPAAAQQLGRKIVTHLRSAGALVDDPQLSYYINRVGRRLARHTDRPASKFHFYVVDNNAINAFALPGGFIGVNSGLLQATGSENELAAVMAHEIAHVTQRHIARQIQETKGATITTLAAILLALIAGGGNPAVIQAAITMGLSSLAQQRISYTRAHEEQADRIGIHTLAASGYDPYAMARFFKNLERQSRLYGNHLPEILQTHPLTKNRIADARARASSMHVGKIHTFYAYPIMRARARVVTSRQPSQVVHYFDEKRMTTHGTHKQANEYGYALALVRIGHAKKAVGILQRLASGTDKHPFYTLALAHALNQSGQPTGALAVLAKVQSRFPTYRPLTLAYAQALITNNRPRDARDYLLGKMGLLTRDAQAQHLLANAANQLGDKGEAYYRGAKYSYLRGKYGPAIRKLLTALQLPELSGHDKSRIKSTLALYRKQCHLLFSEDECEDKVRGPWPARAPG